MTDIVLQNTGNGEYLLSEVDKDKLESSLSELEVARDTIQCFIQLFEKNGIKTTEDELINDLSSGKYIIREPKLPVVVDGFSKQWIDATIGNAKNYESHKISGRLYSSYFLKKHKVPKSIKHLVSLYGNQLFSKLAIDGYELQGTYFTVLDELTNQYLSIVEGKYEWTSIWNEDTCILEEALVPDNFKHLAEEYVK